MKKIKLYTCEAGVRLFKQGRLFSAWTTTDGEVYEHDELDIAVLINPRDVIIDRHGNADILKLDSVEIA